jgi:hypothetical protein
MGEQLNGRSTRVRTATRRMLTLTFVALLALAACSSISTTNRPTPPDTALPPTATSLPIGCPDPNTPAILSGATLTLDRESGPVGTTLGVHATGLQPGCHLWLALSVAPSLAETGGTPIPRPALADEAQQWVAVSAAGTVDTSLCVCEIIPSYVVGYPPYESVTPTSATGGGNTGGYAPKPGDYFFLSIAGGGIPNPPPLYVRFSVTG